MQIGMKKVEHEKLGGVSLNWFSSKYIITNILLSAFEILDVVISYSFRIDGKLELFDVRYESVALTLARGPDPVDTGAIIQVCTCEGSRRHKCT